MAASEDIVIVGAARTPVGSFAGAFGSVPAHELGAVAIKAALERAGVSPDEVDEVIFGQVLTAAAGQNPARQAAIAAGIPEKATAWGLNQVCGSGLRTVAVGMQQIANGDATIIVAGGQESMSLSPHAQYLRGGQKMGDLKLVDTMIKDGLWDAFNGYHMGQTAENVAQAFQLTREQQDQFATRSQNKAEAARKEGRFKEEIVPVVIKNKKGDIVFDTDEGPRLSAPEVLAKLKPAFKKDGKVTAGNASAINDGAAALVIMSEEKAKELGVTPMATWVAGALGGVDPSIMGVGPVAATRKVMAKTGLTVADMDLIEANEAFASQSLAVAHDLEFDMSKVNVNGGAIALGHPVGASGARILVTLLYAMKHRGAKKGLATLCIGGGMGCATIVEMD